MNSLTHEAETIAAARQGELEAFNRLILQEQEFLFRVAWRILRDEHRAADAVQAACLLAFQKLPMFRNGSFRNWFARIVVNVCYDELRRQRRRPLQSLDEAPAAEDEGSASAWLSDPSADPERLLEQRELQRSIETCLRQLSLEHRAVLILVDVEELSYEETAQVLHLPIGTVKSRLARARLQMQAHWRAWHTPGPEGSVWRPGMTQP